MAGKNLSQPHIFQYSVKSGEDKRKFLHVHPLGIWHIFFYISKLDYETFIWGV